jgi:transcriptional regulator with XRE-family HTH domain
MPGDQMSFAAKLKRLRMRSGKSLQQLSEDLDISKAHLWDLESGKSKNPSAELLRKFSDYFEVSVATLVGEETDEDTDEELKVMFRRFQELDPQERALIKALIDAQQKLKGKDTPEDGD